MALLPSHPPDRTARRRASALQTPVVDLSGLEEVAPPRSCLVVVAHPDDDCFGCSGTTAKWAAAGTDVCLAVVTDGSKGSHDLSIPAAEVAARREREQRASAEVLGYREVVFLGHVDGELVVTEEAIRSLVELVRRAQPEVVVSHDPWRMYQLHPDHRAVGELVRDAVWRAAEPRFYEPPAWGTRELWLFNAEEANHIEDVSAWFERKWQALLSHESQFSSAFRFESEEGQVQFEEWFRSRSAAVGRLAGYAYGEAFRRIFL